MVCLGNRDHCVVFTSKYCISDSFVDYDGYSISSKGLLPTVVDIVVIRGGGQEDQPHAMATRAQEGLEELSHVEGQEGQR